MIDKLLKRYSLISDQVDVVELRVILVEFVKILDAKTPGDVVEFGCYKGTTSLFLARILRELKSDKKLFLYDSFAGLPAKTHEDFSGVGAEFQAGELLATKADLVREFAKTFPPEFIYHHVKIIKNWFNDVPPAKLPNQISFAFFDGDFYDSVRDSFAKTDQKFAPCATIVIDDYQNEKLPGAARAVNAWRAKNQLRIAKFRTEKSLGIIYLS